MRPLVEVCLDSVQGAMNAEKGGADRVELCANLMEGGTTPSAGMIALCRKRTTLPIHVMIRPRGGDFCYSDEEYQSMKYDIQLCKSLRVEGIVLGVLKADGSVNVEQTRGLVEAAQPLAVTFHRAFDMTRDPFEALEAIASIPGIQRILTSGQEPSAVEGLDLIQKLSERAAAYNILIMPGCGIHERNVHKFSEFREIHVAANSSVQSSMTFRNTQVYMGAGLFAPEYSLQQTDAKRIANLVRGVCPQQQ